MLPEVVLEGDRNEIIFKTLNLKKLLNHQDTYSSANPNS